jgi:hypothetical protein
MATAEQTTWVCDPTRVSACKCADVEFCGCDAQPNIAGNCGVCGEPMTLVRVDTGEPVEAKVVAS